MTKTDFGIVGWGIAGATMAWQLYFNEKSFLVFDSTENYSSRTAAGIVNPIVFKRLTKSWQADILMPYAESFYRKIESELGEKIIESKQIYKIFSSFEDENNWMIKQSDERFEKYLEPVTSELKIKNVEAEFGYGVVKTFGNLNTIKFLEKSKAFFKLNKINFIDERLNYLEIFKDKDMLCKNLIFCEGFDIINNPFFNYLPLKPTHGETLIIETDEFDFKHILNKNMFVMHLEGNKYKVGATYNWDLKEPICTEKAKEELIEKLSQFTNFNFKVITQQAGIRPTVSDRRPLIGTHPKFDKLHVFNGLGTKGVMIAPFYSKALYESIIKVKELDKEVNIIRYAKYLS
jgi:glycine oxidase